jgi:iron complex transport system permease protein
VVAAQAPYGTRHMKASRLLPLLSLIAVLSLAVAISVGSSSLHLDTVLAAFRDGHDSVARQVILHLRLPRALNAFSIGGLLALAGVLMQVLLRNPLADPYVLGISGGAAVAAFGAMLLGFGALAVDWAAGTGALAPPSWCSRSRTPEAAGHRSGCCSTALSSLRAAPRWSA